MSDDSKLWLFFGLLAVLAYQAGATIQEAVNIVGAVADSVVEKLANGIALAEGYFIPGSRPSRDNNPGDLTIDTIGRAIGKDGIYVVYATPQDGMDALRQQVRLMFGGSHIYNPSMTIQEVAGHYTTTDVDAWAVNVATAAGVTTDTRLSDIPT
jgi:hypothetical protein